ncbi:type II secretion system secretin GspD [uncultured Paludibaculum sp.]|uniref:type II secretion system secretin GspD n=1 Tax=uncultured Paludibaculum sp. TaxID=1765020 RepID=UPI002AAB64A1|nr:type II secretion system secretin GspD [uncultured Paludibaculum sp.]
MSVSRFRSPKLSLVLAALLIELPLVCAQQQPPQLPPVSLPPGFGPRLNGPEPVKPAPQTPAPAPAAAQPSQQAAAPAAPPSALVGGMSLQNVNLLEVVDSLARELKINYIMDKRVGGGVTLNTYGEIRSMDKRALLDTILRINGAAMVQAGDVYRIVPLTELARMPLTPEQDAKNIPEDDRAMLNLVFLKYANVEELAKLVGEFLGPEGKAWPYSPANLLLVLDSRRNMKRTMEMISLFDSDVLAKQRVKLFDLKSSKPSDMAKELEGLLKSMSLSKDLTTVKFVPVDRINTLIAVAPNPGVFDQVQEWIDKLDVKVKHASGKVNTYVYRVKYSQAQQLAFSIMMLYMQMMPGYGGMGGGMYGGGMGGMYGGGMYGGMGGGMYGGTGGMYGGGMYGGTGGMYGGGMYGAAGGGVGNTVQAASANNRQGVNSNANAAQGGYGIGGTDLTGGMLGMGGMYGMGMYGPASPRVVPNYSDNSLLILATPEEYDSISGLLTQLDIPPRQVLIEAKIYEVKLTGALSWGVSHYLFNKDGSGSVATPAGAGNAILGSLKDGSFGMSAGTMVGHSRQLYTAISSQEVASKTKVISAPSVVATDSIAASINVGTEVPTLTAQAVTGATSGGSSLFANTISNRQSGVTLNITARVNPSGIVTLIINQEVSTPQAPAASAAIQSPSFGTRTVQTQVTVQDGDMTAIGGIINETNTSTTTGIPILGRIPILGYAFANRSSNRERTELLVFITPHVIYDTNEMTDASDEMMSKMRRLQKLIK